MRVPTLECCACSGAMAMKGLPRHRPRQPTAGKHARPNLWTRCIVLKLYEPDLPCNGRPMPSGDSPRGARAPPTPDDEARSPPAASSQRGLANDGCHSSPGTLRDTRNDKGRTLLERAPLSSAPPLFLVTGQPAAADRGGAAPAGRRRTGRGCTCRPARQATGHPGAAPSASSPCRRSDPSCRPWTPDR